MYDQEGQLSGLQGDVDYWKNERYVALENDDFTLYEEFQGYFEEAEKKRDDMKAKYEATALKFEAEKVIKEKREFDEEVAEATRVFDERS
jgi:hypothetical protein